MPDLPQDGLLGLDYQELSSIAQKFGQPEFRARQLFEALYPQRLTALDSVTTLP
jgi:adenine C2-methylase RlmN of 23S rRNA A2503 and tRNA A37